MKGRFALFLFSFLAVSCGQVKHVDLYDQEADDAHVANINGFYSLSIYNDQMSDEIWYSTFPKCIGVSSSSTEFHNGTSSISIEWNKQADRCDWIGLGIGWDNWAGKNLSSVVKHGALSFWVKNKQGETTGLPWAVGFEDYSNSQAWTGVTANFVQGGVVKEDWTQVIIPLSSFPFEARDVDVYSIKQVVFQFESSGKVFIDQISLIPFESKGRQTHEIQLSKSPRIDGNIAAGEWPTNALSMTLAKAYVNWDDEFLYVAAEVTDKSPLVNVSTGENIWQGDALELAFSTRPDVRSDRKFYYPSDLHLGIALGAKNEAYNWSTKQAIDGVRVQTAKSANGYTCEIAIPWKSLACKPFVAGQAYDFECAIDIADENGKRQTQSRWNSSDREGFSENPSLWGSILTPIKTYE